jgi:formylglycine-generating enzyme required for sulfatase activity
MRASIMKNECRLFGIIAIIAITGFSYVACPHDGGRGGVAPTISAATLPNGTLDTAYSQTLAATGDKPITWSVTGALPTGLSLEGTTGVISGTPTIDDEYIFTVKAANAAGTDSKKLTITIHGLAPKITTAALPNGPAGTAYSQTLTATGLVPITWSLDNGTTLPTGLSLEGTTGVISGTPTTAGTYSFTVKAANAEGNDTKQLSITIVSFVTMVLIKQGTFTMGSPVNEPDRFNQEIQHQVTLTKDFYMGKYPVTQAQYEALTGNNPSQYKTPVAPETSTANRPVENVTWYDALEFCNKLSEKEGLTPAYTITNRNPSSGGYPIYGANVTWNQNANGYRLPTEAQWEYACRAGTTTPFNTGDNITTDQANYNGNYPYNNNPKGIYLARTTGVGIFAPNAWGLYDMHGNVEEWCWNWSGGPYNSNPQTDPTGPDSGNSKITRGGSWKDACIHLRSAFVLGVPPYQTPAEGLRGFRVVRP